MSPISGSGGRMHRVEEAASLHHLADELSNDLKHWGPHLPDKVHAECSARIARLRDSARAIEKTILEYDVARGGA